MILYLSSELEMCYTEGECRSDASLFREWASAKLIETVGVFLFLQNINNVYFLQKHDSRVPTIGVHELAASRSPASCHSRVRLGTVEFWRSAGFRAIALGCPG